MASRLDRRMKEFLKGQLTVEAIDVGPARDDERADYLLGSGTIVCELKALRADTTVKLQAVLMKWQIPLTSERIVVNSVIKGHRDEERIWREVRAALFSSIEDRLRKANRQIRETKSARNLLNAPGTVILLNDLAADLHPDLLAAGVKEKLAKRKEDRTPKFPEIQRVWIVAEIFPEEMKHFNPRAFATFCDNPHTPPTPVVVDELVRLNKEWAEWNSYPEPVILPVRPL